MQIAGGEDGSVDGSCANVKKCLVFTVREVANPPEDVFPIKGGAKARVRRYHMSFGETSVRYG